MLAALTSDDPTRTARLRRVLAVDALTAVGFGLATSLAAPGLATILAIPESLVRIAGLISLAATVLLAAAALSPAPSRTLVKVIVAGNALWVAASIVLLATGFGNASGMAVIAAQGLFVLVLTTMEHRLAPS